MIKKILAQKNPAEEFFGFPPSDSEPDTTSSSTGSNSPSPIPIPVTPTFLRRKLPNVPTDRPLTTTDTLFEKLDKFKLKEPKTSRSSYTQAFSATQINVLQLFGFNILNFPTEISPKAGEDHKETIIRGLVENHLKLKHEGRAQALRITLNDEIASLPTKSPKVVELTEISKKMKSFKIREMAILEISRMLFALIQEIETIRTQFKEKCSSVLSLEYNGIKKEELEQFSELCFKKYLSQFLQTSGINRLFEDPTHPYVVIATEELGKQSTKNPFMIENMLSKEFLIFILNPNVALDQDSSALLILREFKQYNPNKLTKQEKETFDKMKAHRLKRHEAAPGKHPQGACLEKGLEQAFDLTDTCLQTFHESHVDDKKGTGHLTTHLPAAIMVKYHLTETILDTKGGYCTKDTHECFRLFDEKISPHLFSLQSNQALAIGTDNHIFFITKEIEKDGLITIKLIDPMNSGTFILKGRFQASPQTLSTFKIDSRIRHKKGDEKTVKEAPEMMFSKFFDLWCKKAHLLDCNIAIISRFEHT